MAFSRYLIFFSTIGCLAQAAYVKRVTCPDGVNAVVHPVCCGLFALKDDLQLNVFDGGECNEDVHEILRLAFHDAVGFSTTGQFQGGGADGSMIIFSSTETAYANNAGIIDSVDTLAPYLTRYNISAGDLIQYAAAVGVSNCPGAPQLEFLAGRPNATVAADDGTVPSPADTVTSILARFVDAGFAPTDLVNLLASHSIARADHVDPTIQQVPFDTTPFTFDTQFFLEVLLKGVGYPGTAGNVGEVKSGLADEGEMRLQSDFRIARDPRTACQWQAFIDQQSVMKAAFKLSMSTLATIGQNRAALIDCSDAVPVPMHPVGKHCTYPAQKSFADIQQACTLIPFPSLATDPGSPTQIPKCPGNETTC